MTFDVAQARADTPGCAHVLHFNNAGAALSPTPVLEAVRDHLELEGHVGGYEAAALRHDDLDRFYEVAADLVGARAHEIAFTPNATQAWDLAFYGIELSAGDRILTTRSEYASNVIAFLQVAERTGASLEVVPDDETGQLSVDALADLMDERVKVVAVNHVPSQSGLVNPAAEIGRVVADSDALYLLDACQSVGQIAVDVSAIGCHVLSVTGRKYLRGPRATGFLYVAEAVLDRVVPPMVDLHGASWVAPDSYELEPGGRRFETFEVHVAGKLGLTVAIEYAQRWGIQAIEARVAALAERLRGELESVHGVVVRDPGVRRCGIVTFTVEGTASAEVKARLTDRGINTWESTRFSARNDFAARGLDSVVRASVHYYNDDAEIDRFVSEVAALAGPLTN